MERDDELSCSRASPPAPERRRAGAETDTGQARAASHRRPTCPDGMRPCACTCFPLLCENSLLETFLAELAPTVNQTHFQLLATVVRARVVSNSGQQWRLHGGRRSVTWVGGMKLPGGNEVILCLRTVSTRGVLYRQVSKFGESCGFNAGRRDTETRGGCLFSAA